MLALRTVLSMLMSIAVTGAALAQTPPAPVPAAPAARPEAPEATPARRPSGAISSPSLQEGRGPNDIPQANAEHPKLFFHEKWNDLDAAQPITQEHLSNQNLVLHVYGDGLGVRKTKHPTENYLYSGETQNNWALTVGDRNNLVDVSGLGKIRWKTKQSGFRFLHVVIKTADGKYYVSEEGDGETSD